MIKLGKYIELSNKTNNSEVFSVDDVRGISIKKMFIPTKADMDGVSLHKYLVINPKYFCYVTVTSRNGEKISIAFNSTSESFIVSSSYVSFYVKDESKLLPEYLFMYFNRPEFDRYSRFNSWGSARETFSFDDLCDLDIDIPSIDKQKQVVDVYLALVENHKKYEQGLDDLKLVCDAYIEQLFKKQEIFKLEKFITRRMEKNSKFTISRLVGVGQDGFIEPKQSKDETNGHICYLIKKNDFCFAPPQLHAGSIDLWNHSKIVKCSDAYIVFYINNQQILLNSYLKSILLLIHCQ